MEVRRVVTEAIEERGIPKYIRSDNGSGFRAKIMQEFFRELEINTIYIDLGSPWQNGFAKSFNSRMGEEVLERELIWNLKEARVLVEDWRNYYNNERADGSLKMLTPTEFADKNASGFSSTDTPPRGSIGDIYDRNKNIDIYEYPYKTLNNNTSTFLSHKVV